MHPPARANGRRARWLAAALLACHAACAAQPEDRSAWSFTLEDDYFFASDHWYTTGLQYERKSKHHEPWPATAQVLETVCAWVRCGPGAQLFETRSRVNHLMYSPSHRTVSTPQPWDRPWAALLSYAHDYAFLAPDARKLTTLSAQAGITGPHAHGRELQRGFHRLIHDSLPAGWAHQIGESVGLLASVEQRRAWGGWESPAGGSQLRTDWYWKAAAGNIFTHAGVGTMLRWGHDLPAVEEVTHIPQAKLRSRPAESFCHTAKVECMFFASVEGRLIAYNVFLDGRLGHPDDSHVRKRPFVMDVALGVRLDLPQGCWWRGSRCFVQFRANHRSREFRSAVENRSQSWGALTIGTYY